MSEGQGYMKYPCPFFCAELVIANKKFHIYFVVRLFILIFASNK